jgi:hypothetical protein
MDEALGLAGKAEGLAGKAAGLMGMKAVGLGHRRGTGRRGHKRAARAVHLERLPSLAGLDSALLAATLAVPVSGVRCPGMETFRVLTATGDKSETICERVVQARKIQDERFRKSGNATNSAMNPRQMKLHCQIDAEGTGDLEHAMEEMNFTARTQADLVGAESIRLNDVLEAIQYCSLDRKLVS